MAFTEFYCQSGGSNVNAGSTTNNTAAYTSTNGNWNGTSIFTPTDGSTPASSIAVGDFVSVYLDGATVAVFIARVTVVAAGVNGAITVSTTVKAGSAPTSGATGRSIKAGGAWLGLNAASNFPFSLVGLCNATNTNADTVRVNLKNNQTYTLTGSLDISNNTQMVLQGYTTTPGDGGRAEITTNVTSSYGSSWTGLGGTLVDIIFTNTGASNTNDVVRCTGTNTVFQRCVFRGARGAGLFASSTSNVFLVECELYGNNTSNTASKAAIVVNNGTIILVNCYIHDNTGSNSTGIINSAGNLVMVINSIFDTNGNHGIDNQSTSGSSALFAINNDFYNNTGDAIKLNSGVTADAWSVIRNNNFIKNGGKAINNAVTSTTGGTAGISENNGYGAGTQANGSSDTLKSIISSGSITYASGVTPWVDPANGDFRINLTAAMGVGRGAFLETDASLSAPNTVGYPDIGAAQAQPGTGAGQKSFTFGA